MKDLISGVSGKLFIINSLTATAYAFILPVMSVYLVNGIGASPDFIAYYSVSFAISGMVFSQLFGALSDRGVNDRWLFILSVICIASSAVCFSYVTHPWQALVIGVVLMGPGNACIPLILSMIKRFAEQSGKNVTKLNTQMRSGVSVVWIIGPALAFVIADFWGYQANFAIVTILAVLVILLSLIYLPAFNSNNLEIQKEANTASGKLHTLAFFLGGIILFGNLANHVYITAMPLYLTQEVGIPMYFPGLLLGVTAAFEIPVMLIAGSLCDKYGKYRLMSFAFICAITYYALLQVITSMSGLILIQVINGLFYGIFVGLGITIIQDMFPKNGGFASAYYTNVMRIGMMAGTSLVGVIAEYIDFKVALSSSLVATSVALCLMTYVTKKSNSTVKVYVS